MYPYVPAAYPPGYPVPGTVPGILRPAALRLLSPAPAPSCHCAAAWPAAGPPAEDKSEQLKSI